MRPINALRLRNPSAAAATSLSYVGGFQAVVAFNTTADAVVSLTSLTGGSDSAPQVGDLVVVAWGEQGGTPSLGATGYTAAFTQLRLTSPANMTLACLYKLMGGTPDTSVTLTGRTNSGTSSKVAIHVWRGVNQTTPIDVTPTTATGTPDGQPDPPSITPLTAGAMILCGGVAWRNPIIGAFTSADLSNFLTASGTSSGTGQITIGLGSIAWTSSAFNEAKWGGGSASTGAGWAAFSLALRPA